MDVIGESTEKKAQKTRKQKHRAVVVVSRNATREMHIYIYLQYVGFTERAKKLYEAFVSFVFHGICFHLGIMVASCRTRRTMSPLAAGFRGWPWRMLIAYAVDSTILEETHRAAALCGGGC
jgi:hypothetical protein